MKKILMLDFSFLLRTSQFDDLRAEFAKRKSFNGKNLSSCYLKREVAEFYLPVGSIGRCFFQYDNNGHSLACNVDSYAFESNRDFSEQTTYVYLKVLRLAGYYDAKEIVDYLEREWKV